MIRPLTNCPSSAAPTGDKDFQEPCTVISTLSGWLAHFSSLLLNTTLCVANVRNLCWISVGIDKPSFSNNSPLDSRKKFFSILLSYSDVDKGGGVEFCMWQVHQSETSSEIKPWSNKTNMDLALWYQLCHVFVVSLGKCSCIFLVTSSVNKCTGWDQWFLNLYFVR